MSSTAERTEAARHGGVLAPFHFKELDDLELISVATVVEMSTPKEYIAYYKRVRGLA